MLNVYMNYIIYRKFPAAIKMSVQTQCYQKANWKKNKPSSIADDSSGDYLKLFVITDVWYLLTGVITSSWFFMLNVLL